MTTCLVFTCGPSLLDYINFIKKYSDIINEARHLGKLKVVCIKSSVNTFSDICDYHIYNQINLNQISLEHEVNHIYVGIKKFIPQIKRLGHKTIETRSAHGLLTTMAANGDFRDTENAWDNESVQWGPGIIYEGLLPFLVKNKFKKVYIFGWDMSPVGTYKGDHFDGEYFTQNVQHAALVQESSLIVHGTEYMYNYLKNTHGMEMYIISSKSQASIQIPRLSVKQVLFEINAEIKNSLPDDNSLMLVVCGKNKFKKDIKGVKIVFEKLSEKWSNLESRNQELESILKKQISSKYYIFVDNESKYFDESKLDKIIYMAKLSLNHDICVLSGYKSLLEDGYTISKCIDYSIILTTFERVKWGEVIGTKNIVII